jgi:hypothetical protein
LRNAATAINPEAFDGNPKSIEKIPYLRFISVGRFLWGSLDNRIGLLLVGEYPLHVKSGFLLL